MTTIVNGSDNNLGIPEQYQIKPNRRKVQLDQLIEMRDFRIVGQEGGMLLIEVELDINKEPYLFIGPLQVVRIPSVEKQNGPMIVKLPDLDKE